MKKLIMIKYGELTTKKANRNNEIMKFVFIKIVFECILKC